MSKEKGASVVLIAIVIATLIAVGGISIYTFSGDKKSVEGANNSSTDTTTDAPEEIFEDSEGTQSLISYDSFVYTSPSAVYYHIPAASLGSTGTAGESEENATDSTEKVGKFVLIPGADPASFSEIKTIPIQNPPASDEGTAATATYYKDNDEVFVAQTITDSSGNTESSVSSVIADPATFQILNDTYAKDADHVYVVSWVCEGDTCTLQVVVVVGADPATFHVIEDTVVQKSDGSGTVTADAVDSTHLFNNGSIVDTVETPGSDETDMTPILISP